VTSLSVGQITAQLNQLYQLDNLKYLLARHPLSGLPQLMPGRCKRPVIQTEARKKTMMNDGGPHDCRPVGGSVCCVWNQGSRSGKEIWQEKH